MEPLEGVRVSLGVGEGGDIPLPEGMKWEGELARGRWISSFSTGLIICSGDHIQVQCLAYGHLVGFL